MNIYLILYIIIGLLCSQIFSRIILTEYELEFKKISKQDVFFSCGLGMFMSVVWPLWLIIFIIYLSLKHRITE